MQQVALFFDAAQFASSEEIDFHIWFSPGFLMLWRQARQDSFRCLARQKFIIGFEFAVTLSAPESFLRSFRHHFRTIGGTEMANVKQTQKMIPFITCEISFGQYVCELVFGVDVFDLDIGVQMETCLMVGLLPLKIVLITASLSSNTYNKASWWEELTFEKMKSTLSKSLIIPWDCFRFWIVWGVDRTSRWFGHRSLRALLLWFVFPRTATIRSHKSNAGIPSILKPASKERISDSVELCETEVCFLHIQLIGTNVRLPKNHNTMFHLK